MKCYGLIYIAKCISNGACYVGWTVNFKKRREDHIQSALKGSKACPRFYNAIRKYGPEKFIWSIVDWSSSEFWIKHQEKRWIKKLNSFHAGLNCTVGGDGTGSGKDHPMFGRHNNAGKKHWLFGKHHSLEARAKIKAARAKQIIIGKPKSLETRLKIAASLRGRQLSKRTRLKISISMKNHFNNMEESNVAA